MGRLMARLRIRYVHRFRDRHGQVRHYFRRPGYQSAALPGDPGSPEFREAYEAAMQAEKRPIGATRCVAGTIDALVVAYYASTEYRQCAAVTRATYRNLCEQLRAEHGPKPVALLQREHIRRLVARKSATPAAANATLKMLRILLAFAVDDGWRRDNPAVGIKRQRSASEGFAVWSEADIAAFEARWPRGTRERTALVLLLCTGQRRGDVVGMGRQHIRLSTGVMDVRQSKTGTRLQIPLMPELLEELELVPSDRMTILMTGEGKPFSPAGFTNWFRDACAEAGLVGRSAHGLRKASATRLADAGATPHQLMAIFGWRTLKEAERYTRSVDQLRLARSGIALLKPGMKTESGT